MAGGAGMAGRMQPLGAMELCKAARTQNPNRAGLAGQDSGRWGKGVGLGGGGLPRSSGGIGEAWGKGVELGGGGLARWSGGIGEAFELVASKCSAKDWKMKKGRCNGCSPYGEKAPSPELSLFVSPELSPECVELL